MRPLSITLEGFSAYRNRQTLALEDVEFFSLSGPTGSGKSSLIDAMIFALYGRVPRLGARAVAPVITAGAHRARVAFQFEVRGDAYTVSRVAERTGSGAAVREARLETTDGDPVASGAGEVTRAVEELLRLRFEDFTKTVVLPQGEFARFLNAGSRERRDLLRDLLGLDIYSQVRELAAARKSAASGHAGSARSQLESLDVPGAGDVEEAKTRLEALQALSREIGRQLGELSQGERLVEGTRKRAEDLDDARTRLTAIAPPDHLEEMEEHLVATREAETLAGVALEARQEVAQALQAEIDELPGEETIAAIRLAHEELSRIDERIAGLDLEAAHSAVSDAESALERSEKQLDAARLAADAARVRHAAHTVGSTLVVGELCPVCARAVETIPETEAPPALAEVDETVDRGRSEVASLREALHSAKTHLTEAVTRASELGGQRAALVERIADSPSPEELAAAEVKLAAATRSLQDLRSEIEDLETALRHARRDHEEAAERFRSVGRALMVARETVADLKPPHSESDDPTVQWKDLLAWRHRAVDDVVAEREALLDDLKHEQARLAELRSSLVARLTAVGVPAEEPYDVTVARDLEAARNRLARIEEVRDRAESLEKDLERASRTEAIAGALANHLRANGFERWLMAGAITDLVNGANQLLSQLSDGGYSLQSDEEGSFRIIDHRNADEVRDVATLSGGETFLVSLALSLSLAETLSAAGGAGLDAIILDEGFGTLDEESLDVVAAVLEELAGTGLMVGVITHVKELAARAPVRYQVTREPGGSKVEVVT